ncbi:DUF2147 domain-containing protein [bacterium]|nr:MAG: DUF2147 domain-containing protein [bacterium]
MNTVTRTLLALLSLFVLGGVAPLLAQEDSTAANAVLGEWLTAEGTSKILIFKCGDEYCGKISWLKEPERDGKARVDEKNPEERLRTQPLLGMTILRGFAFDGDDTWKGGKIYDPKSGNDYSAKMSLADPNTLELRGYILIPLLGRTETWTR